MPVYDIYTYGGGTYLVQVFTAMKLFFGSDHFISLARLAGLLGLVWITLNMMGRKPYFDIKYILIFAMVYLGLFVPKSDVAIVDRINPVVTGPVVVEDVPFGLAMFGHVASSFGDGMTRLYETYISIPGDFKYQQNGMLFGAALIRTGYDLQFPDADFAHDMGAWLEQCGFWQVTRGLISEDELAKSEDIWTLLSANPSTLRYVKQSQVNSGTGDHFWTCKAAANNLDNRWNAQVDGAATLWGTAVWPWKTNTDAKAAVLATASGAYNYLAQASRSASEHIQQNIMINATRQALTNFAASSDATAVAVNIAQAQAEAAQRTSYLTYGNMAAKLLPIAHLLLEAILYGIFPIVAFFLLLPTVAAMLLQYLKLLVWLQLWAPVYAIVNSLMTWYGQYKNGAASLLDPALGNHGVALETANALAHVNADLLATAGYMAFLSVTVAWMLVQYGAIAATSLVSGLMQPAQSAAQSASMAAASGNVTLGSLSTDTVARNTLRENKLDSNVEALSGGHALQTVSGAMVRSFGHGASGALYDAGHSIPSPGASANVKGAIGAAYHQASRQQETVAEGATQASTHALASAIDQYAAYDRQANASGSARTSASIDTDGSVGTGAGEMARFMEQFGQDHKWSSSQAATLLATAQAGAGTGALHASGQFQGKSDAQLQTALDDTNKYMRENNWQEKFDSMRKGSTGESYESADAGGRTALDGVRANLQASDGWRREASVARSRSAAFEQAASEVRNSALETGTSYNRTMMQDLERAGVTAGQWDQLGDAQRGALVNAWAQDYADAHANEVLYRHGITPPDHGAAGNLYSAAAQNPSYGPQEVEGQYQAHRGEVEGRQQAAGLTPGEMPANSVTGQARAVQHEARGRIDDIQAGVDARGGEVQAAAQVKTGAPSLSGDAIAGVTQILNANTPLGNPGQYLQGMLSELGFGTAPRADTKPMQPAPNAEPRVWGGTIDRGESGR